MGDAVVVVPLPMGDEVVVKTNVVISPVVSFAGVGVVWTNVVVPITVSVLVFAGSAVVVSNCAKNVVVAIKVSVLVFAGSAVVVSNCAKNVVVVIKVSVLVFTGSAVVVSSCAILTVIMVMQMLMKSMACGLLRALESLNITIPELAFGPTDKTGKKKM